MKTVILSLHPCWWDKMAAGEKLLEIRKTRPVLHGAFRVLVYVTGGVGVCGEFICPNVWKIQTAPNIQKRVGVVASINVERDSCLTQDALADYAGPGGRPLWGWQVERVKTYAQPVPLALYGMGRPPQSWCYFNGAEPYLRCAVCGKIVDNPKPCPYDRAEGRPTCPQCCEKCFQSEPFPCWEHDRRMEGEGRT